MTEAEYKENTSGFASPGGEDELNSGAFTGRVEGDYSYKGEYSQPIYSDAHYVPASENTVPPRFYAPPEKPVKEPKEKRKAGKAAKLIAMCLVCAILGGIAGAGLMTVATSGRISALEESISLMKEEETLLQVAQSEQPRVETVIYDDGSISAATIYDLACSQVVGITSEVTYTNFFGMVSSAPVSGSGFFVSDDGYILTNYHVVEHAVSGNVTLDVITHDGTRYEATIVGTEPDNDVAVLKIEAEGHAYATLADSDSMQVGDLVYAVGNPLGELEFSMSTGHVSALDRLISTDANSEPINMFQIDAAVNSGNSGGPIYNDRGEVVGIVTAKHKATGVEGLGFAIPINDAAGIANDLITVGYVTGKAQMGVSLDNRYTSQYSNYWGIPLGACIYSVEPGSSAEKAGLRAGDVITQLGDIVIESNSELVSAMKKFSAGETVPITLHREGKSLTVEITFDEAKPDTIS